MSEEQKEKIGFARAHEHAVRSGRKGGLAANNRHKFTSEEARRAGRKGAAIAKRRGVVFPLSSITKEQASENGRKGGFASAEAKRKKREEADRRFDEQLRLAGFE